ncbi:MAG: alpha/beta fold hydrolase [Mycobacteriaceae bacterium]|nr:alpha/beta fold hydrolase [Mycobacteriaceae bacterium]
MAANLCLPAGSRADTVMVLMPGSNYNHAYWDFPYRPEKYSFRRAMNAAGIATLVVDRLGNGASSRPPSIQVTSHRESKALHNIVQALRRGTASSPSFARIVTVGHSLSSSISAMEASDYQDVDGVILTGFSHKVDFVQAAAVIAGYRPANTNPMFADKGYDTGYLATPNGTMGSIFHAAGDVEPQVLAVDEANKDVFTPTEYMDGLPITLPGGTAKISARVLVVDGSLDRLCSEVCKDAATLMAAEAPHFSPATQLRTYVLQGSGHSMNLARNTADYQKAILDWMHAMIRKQR